MTGIGGGARASLLQSELGTRILSRASDPKDPTLGPMLFSEAAHRLARKAGSTVPHDALSRLVTFMPGARA